MFGAPQLISTAFASWQRYCSDVTQRKPTKLCMVFGHYLGWYTAYTFSGFLPRYGILPVAKFTLRPSVALSYFGSVTARHSSSRRRPNFSALSTGRHLYSAWRLSRWALAHIFSCSCIVVLVVLHIRQKQFFLNPVMYVNKCHFVVFAVLCAYFVKNTAISVS